VALAIAGQRVDLLNVHPSIPRIRSAQVGPLELPIGLDTQSQAAAVDLELQRITAAPRALLVVGDLNMTDRQPSYQRLRVRLGDAFREAGWGLGLTFPQDRTLHGLPLPVIVRLDYILHSDVFTATSAHVGIGPGSDHRFVVADLLLRSS
jgi:endonuclease/exonuclease/phosphatase (EEP) superfamily protein YafD